MDSINPDDFSKSQLQIWCKNLGLPDTGTKNVLAERLNQLSPVARGQHPKDGAAPNGGLSKRADPPEKDCLEHLKSILYSSDDGAGQTQNFEADLFQGQQQQEVTANEQNKAENGQNEAENDQNDAESETQTENESITNEPQEISKATNEKSNEKSNNGERNATNEKSNEKSNNGERNGTNEKSNEESQKEENIVKYTLEKKLELLCKEIELVRRENEFLRLAGNPESGHSSSWLATKTGDQVLAKDVKDFVLDFDGNGNVYSWISSMLHLERSFNLNENNLRLLVFGKLKGKALDWIHSNPECLCQPVKTIFDAMGKVFGSKKTNVIIRREFEARKWCVGEPFLNYFNDKVGLAGGLRLPEDEMVEYIVDGIPDRHLREMACMQRFGSKDDVLAAFVNIVLQREKPVSLPNVSAKKKPTFRCFNCNCLGHLAADCNKPIRATGACFGCGEMGHRVADCSQNKKKPAAISDAS
ncbi:uncharacterized protein LOC124460838 [Drosophila willistoni]|uniref:uncharacterized protein LOC124460838 n=1 Tax=Drosophila willistoni TaxID=7260 RepID=UPI001F0824F5|nr:uncharacterized protein LOC124460838 [Drosophila willistoni]